MGRGVAIRTSLCAALVASCSGSPSGTTVDVPGGAGGIGFDDLRYSAALHRVLAPAGLTGTLALVDPDSLAVSTVPGFSATGSYDGTHDFGATSVDEGRGVLFVTDRTSQTLDVVDPTAGAIVTSVGLAASPDYVRYVAATDELWVTEPAASQIEVFSLSSAAVPVPTSVATIPVANGPESLVIDQTAGRAYTHRWQSTTVVLDVRTRAPVAEWPNGCAASRGLAVDEARGFFYVACSEGTVSVLDAAGAGTVLSTMARGAGYDVIGYSSSLGHLYLAGTACKCLVILGVSASGSLSFLGRFDATSSAHCASADDRGHAWVCDPDGGRLLRIDDPYPASW
jgi:DNA-binding beta-propeller fold protein YncE